MREPVVTVETIDLGYEQLLRLDAGAGRRVRVLFGGLWLTEEGEARDRIVRPGDEVPLRGRGTVLLEGIGPARVQILKAHAPGLRPRLARAARRALAAARRLSERLHLGGRPAAEPLT